MTRRGMERRGEARRSCAERSGGGGGTSRAAACRACARAARCALPRAASPSSPRGCASPIRSRTPSRLGRCRCAPRGPAHTSRATACCISPVPAQMWQGRARSRRRSARGEPSPGADVGTVEPGPGADVGTGEPSPGANGERGPAADASAVSTVPVQIDLRGASPVPVQMWAECHSGAAYDVLLVVQRCPK